LAKKRKLTKSNKKATKKGNFGVSNRILKPEMKVLLSLPTYPTNKTLSNNLKLNKSYISRLTTKLKNKRLIKYNYEFNIKKFSLTKLGIDVVANFLAISKAIETKQCIKSS